MEEEAEIKKTSGKEQHIVELCSIPVIKISYSTTCEGTYLHYS